MEKTMKNLISLLSEATHKENLDNIDYDSDIKEHGIDSLDAMSFFFSIEKAFGVKITSQEQSNLNSLNEILNHIKSC